MIELKTDVKFNERSLRNIVEDIKKYKKQKKGALFAIKKMAKRNFFTVNEIVDKFKESNVINEEKQWSANVHNKTGFSVVSKNNKKEIFWDNRNPEECSFIKEQEQIEDVAINLTEQAKDIGLAKELFNMWINISNIKRPLFNKDKINTIKDILVDFSIEDVKISIITKFFLNKELVRMGHVPDIDLTDFKAVFDKDSIAKTAKYFR